VRKPLTDTQRLNLSKGVGRGGKSPRDLWIEQGMTAAEADARELERIALQQAVRSRTMAIRAEKKALSLGLGDAVVVATTIEEVKRDITREFKQSPLKGMQRQTTVVRRQQKRMADTELREQRSLDPRVKGLKGVTGVEVDEDGTIGLKALREQRPDIFAMTPIPVEGREDGASKRINQARLANGREDKFYDKRKPR
jgi:hypothetical protein